MTTTTLLDRPAQRGRTETVTDAHWAQIVDQITRREFIGAGAGGALTLGLAAVGAPAASAAGGGPTRLVMGAYGDVRLPAHPSRVVAMSKAAIETALDVGLTPVGVDEGEAAVALPAYKRKLARIPTVGTYGNFNVEKIAELKPDLVMSYDTYISRKLYAQITEFAPVFALKTDNGNISWENGTEAFANALNRNGALGALKYRYLQRVAQVRQTYEKVLRKNRWEIVQSAGAGVYFRYLPSSDPSRILAALGATLGNAGAKGPNYWGPTLSYETLGAQLGEATVILAVEVNSPPLLSAPTFKALPAAEAGHVYATNLLFPGGYSGAIDLVDFIEDVCRKLG